MLDFPVVGNARVEGIQAVDFIRAVADIGAIGDDRHFLTNSFFENVSIS